MHYQSHKQKKSNTAAYQHSETNINDDDYSKLFSFLLKNSLKTLFKEYPDNVWGLGEKEP